jgi:hypothetical protein
MMEERQVPELSSSRAVVESRDYVEGEPSLLTPK